MNRQKNLWNMQKFQFLYLHIGLIPQFFLRRSHVMLLDLCLCVVNFKTTILKAQSHFTLTALPEHFFVTPLALQTRHLSCVSDGDGQCLLPQTSSLATRFSTLGGLPNGLVTLRSGPACANIFLTWVSVTGTFI